MTTRQPSPWVIALAAQLLRLADRRAPRSLALVPPALRLHSGYGRTHQRRFEAFHARNPWVYDTLVRLARDYRTRGYERIGIGHLWEVMRWQYRMQTSDPASDFKLNNDYRSRYSRLIMDREPDLADVFEIRELKTA